MIGRCDDTDPAPAGLAVGSAIRGSQCVTVSVVTDIFFVFYVIKFLFGTNEWSECFVD